MRKIGRGEWGLFLVPLAFVPLALALVRAKQKLDQQPTPTYAAPTPMPTPLLARRDGSHSNILPSRDGRVYYTADFQRGARGTVHEWDVATNVRLRSLGTMRPDEGSLRLSPDGLTAFYATNSGFDGVVLNTRTGAERALFERNGGENFSDAAINDDLLASGRGSQVLLRSLQDGREVGRIQGTPNTFASCLTFSPDGSILAWVSGGTSTLASNGLSHGNGILGREVVAYSMRQKRRLFSWPLEDSVVFSIAISGDNDKLAVLTNYHHPLNSPQDITPSDDDILLVLSLKNGQQIFKLNSNYAASKALAISPDGRWLAFKSAAVKGSYDSMRLQVADLSTGQVIAGVAYESHNIAFSMDSRELFMDNYHQRFRRMPSGEWKPIH